MKRFYNILFFTACVFLTGCHKTGVRFTDFRTAPTMTITNDVITIHFQGVYLASGAWAQMNSKVEGQTLCVYGYQTSTEPEMDHDYIVKLPASLNAQSINVVWRNPDGSRVPIPATN